MNKANWYDRLLVWLLQVVAILFPLTGAIWCIKTIINMLGGMR